MKKLFALLLALTMLFSLTACLGDNSTTEKNHVNVNNYVSHAKDNFSLDLTAAAGWTVKTVKASEDGKTLEGIVIGDGPIDAAFRAIEQIVGHHYELDDFQIQSVTEGKEAMASALVKLRSNGKLYSGNGISTDIVGAGIRAFINAVNKIVYEEA